VGNVCRVKRFHLRGKRFVADEEVETRGAEVAETTVKRLCFDALVKRWEMCISVGGGHVEK
jgi:hypothetical protein